MRIFLANLAILTLSACQAQPDPGPQPNAALVEGALQNEQLNEAIAIENDAKADNFNVDPDDDV